MTMMATFPPSVTLLPAAGSRRALNLTRSTPSLSPTALHFPHRQHHWMRGADEDDKGGEIFSDVLWHLVMRPIIRDCCD